MVDLAVPLPLAVGWGRRGEQAVSRQAGCEEEGIVATFCEPQSWERLDAKRACGAHHEIQAGGFRDAEKWPVISRRHGQAMDRLMRALRPEVRQLGG
jgi:hypothetical protein